MNGLEIEFGKWPMTQLTIKWALDRKPGWNPAKNVTLFANFSK